MSRRVSRLVAQRPQRTTRRISHTSSRQNCLWYTHYFICYFSHSNHFIFFFAFIGNGYAEILTCPLKHNELRALLKDIAADR